MEFLLSHNETKSNPIFSSVSDLDTLQIPATRSDITIIEAGVI